MVLRAFGPLKKTPAVFALRWLCVILPSAVFWILLRRWMLDSGVQENAALVSTLAGALGSLSLTYGQMFAGHQMAALALGAAFLCASWGSFRPFWVGFFCALAVALEYPSAPAAAILVAAALLRHRRGGLRLSLGALPWMLVLAQFHWSAFGAPWSTPYGHLENPAFVRDIAPGLMGISAPSWERIYGSLFSPWLGLFFWAPWTALALLAPRWLRRFDLVPVAVVAYYLVFQITHALWRSGWTVGPRYITPVAPFAAMSVALVVREAPRLLPMLRGLGAAAVATTGLASAVSQGFPLEVINPLREVVGPLLAHGYVPRNLLQWLGAPRRARGWRAGTARQAPGSRGPRGGTRRTGPSRSRATTCTCSRWPSIPRGGRSSRGNKCPERGGRACTFPVGPPRAPWCRGPSDRGRAGAARWLRRTSAGGRAALSRIRRRRASARSGRPGSPPRSRRAARNAAAPKRPSTTPRASARALRRSPIPSAPPRHRPSACAPRTGGAADVRTRERM